MRNQELHPRTAVINRKQKLWAKKSRNDALQWLTARFPNAFDNTVSIQPLKIGIMNDILVYADEAEQAGFSKSKLREAVVLYTRRIDYLTCLKAREMRVDLLGNLVGPVTEDEAARAAAKIKKRVEKSAKNARKHVAASKPVFSPRASHGNVSHSDNDAPSYYPERLPAFSSSTAAPQPPKVASIMVKHKTTRQYDPDAVARLKEKLGLARKAGETEPVE